MAKNDLTKRSWPIYAWWRMFAEGTREADDGDGGKTCRVAGDDCVDEMSGSYGDTCYGGWIHGGGLKHCRDGLGDAMTGIGRSLGFVPGGKVRLNSIDEAQSGGLMMGIGGIVTRQSVISEQSGMRPRLTMQQSLDRFRATDLGQ
jgi:hypothetical protein